MIENTVLHDAVVEVLGVSVMERAAIVDALVAGAKVLGSVDAIDRSLVHLLQLDTRFTEVAAGVAHLPSLLEGTRWTVWIDADDAAEGYVRSAPNLEPLIWWLIGGDVLAVDGTGAPIGLIETDGMWVDGEDSEIDVVMPPGQILADLSGGWATVTVAGGALHWERCNVPPAPDQRQVAALRVGFGRSADAVTYIDVDIEDAPPPHLRFALGEGPIHEAILDDRTAFLATPSAPLADLYAAVGLERRAPRSPSAASTGTRWRDGAQPDGRRLVTTSIRRSCRCTRVCASRSRLARNRRRSRTRPSSRRWTTARSARRSGTHASTRTSRWTNSSISRPASSTDRMTPCSPEWAGCWRARSIGRVMRRRQPTCWLS